MQKSRVRRVGALIVGLSLVAAACGDDDDPADVADSVVDDAEDAADDAEDAADDAADDMTEDDTSDMSEEDTSDMSEEDTSDMSEEDTSDMSEEDTSEEAAPAGGSDGVFRVGGILPETGNLAFLGPPEIAGVNLAVQEINAAGGVNGADMEYLPGDSGDNGEVANATVDRLLAEDVDAFIGAASSGVSLTVIDKITQAGKIHFSPANTSPTFTDYDDNGLYFRTAPSDVIQGAALADLMLQDGAATAAFLVLNDSYGTGLQQFTIEPYTEGGGTVVYGDLGTTYDPQAENFDAEIAAVVDANPDAIVIIGFDETAQILGGLTEAGFGTENKMIYGTDGNMGNGLANQFLASGNPEVVAGMKGTLPGVDVVGELADFQAKLLEVDGGLNDYSYSAEAYDAITVMALAASIAGSDDGTAVAAEINGVTKDGEKCTSFAECIELVNAGTDIDYDGVSGPLDFTDAGEPSAASILILQFDAEGDGIDTRTNDDGEEVVDDVDVIGSIQGSL